MAALSLVVATVSDAAAFALLTFRRQIKKPRRIASRMTATAPTAIPTIAPVGRPSFSDRESGVSVCVLEIY